MNRFLPYRIRLFRKQLGLTQEALAERCEVTASCISRWETGKWIPNSNNAMILSRALQVSIEDLYDNQNHQDENVIIQQVTNEVQTLTEKEQKYILKMIIELKKLSNS